MEREEPPPMTSEATSEVKKDIFDDDDDDELFKSAIDEKLGGGAGTAKITNEQIQEKTNEIQEIEEEVPTSTSGYETSEVKHSNTLEDLDDQDVFKSVVEPSSEKFNGNEISEEKDIPLDDDEEEPEYEEEKLTVTIYFIYKMGLSKSRCNHSNSIFLGPFFKDDLHDS